MAFIEPHTDPVSNLTKKFFWDQPTVIDYESVTYRELGVQSLIKIQPGSSVQFSLPALVGQECYLMHDLVVEMKLNILLKNGMPIPDDETLQEAPQFNTGRRTTRRGAEEPLEDQQDSGFSTRAPRALGNHKVALVNLPLHSMIRDLSIKLGNTECNPNGVNYNYAAYIRNLLSFDKFYKDTTLECAGFVEDTGGAMEVMGPGNSGWMTRYEWFFNSEGRPTNKSRTFVGKLMTPFISATCPIPCGVSGTITLYLNTNSFMLCQSTVDQTEYIVDIESIQLFVPVGVLNLRVYDGLMASWKKENRVRMHLRRYVCDIFPLPGQGHTFPINLHSMGKQMPSRIVVGLVVSDHMNSVYSNPYVFHRNFTTGDKSKDAYIVSLTASVGGRILDAFFERMTEDEARRMYFRFLYSNGFVNTSGSNYITYKDFLSGYFFACFDLTTSNNAYDPDFVPTPRTGGLSLMVEFSRAPPIGLQLLYLAEYPGTLTFGINGEVSTSYVD